MNEQEHSDHSSQLYDHKIEVGIRSYTELVQMFDNKTVVTPSYIHTYNKVRAQLALKKYSYSHMLTPFYPQTTLMVIVVSFNECKIIKRKSYALSFE